MTISREQFEGLKTLSLFKSKVISDSMVPVIQIGEEVIIDIGNMDIKRFDIIVIYLDGKIVCHYLWHLNRYLKPILLQTRNMSGKMDFPVKIEDYLGKVMSHKLSLWQKFKIIF